MKFISQLRALYSSTVSSNHHPTITTQKQAWHAVPVDWLRVLPAPPGYMQRKALPSSSACTLPAGVSSPPHFRISTSDGSRGPSETRHINIFKHCKVLVIPYISQLTNLSLLTNCFTRISSHSSE